MQFITSLISSTVNICCIYSTHSCDTEAAVYISISFFLILLLFSGSILKTHIECGCELNWIKLFWTLLLTGFSKPIEN